MADKQLTARTEGVLLMFQGDEVVGMVRANGNLHLSSVTDMTLEQFERNINAGKVTQ